MANVPTSGEWVIFLSTAVVLAVTPGPAMLYVLSRTLSGGRREGILSATGNALGDVVHVAAAAIGLSALLAASPTLFMAIRVLGAGYLVYLGVRVIQRRAAGLDLAGVAASAGSTRTRSPLAQGVVVETLNPKAALYFMALLPQFVHPDRAPAALVIGTLGLVVVVTALCVDAAVALAATMLRDRLTGDHWQVRQRMASGVMMIGLGAYVAVM